MGQDKDKKLSPLGQQLEKSLIKMMANLDKDPTATVLDRLRVYDRALKLESIKAKISEEEGGFFTPEGANEDE